jgi:hypothetical protein
MGNARSSRNVVGPLHPTRQQLDELDALLQRMLDLPVNRVEEKTAEPAPTPRLTRVTLPAPLTQAGQTPQEPTSTQPPRKETPAPEQVAQPVTPESKGTPLQEDGPEGPVSPLLPVQPPHRLRKRTPPLQTTAESEEDTKGPEGEWVPFRSSWKPSPHTWPPLAESWAQAQQGTDLGRVRRDEPASEPVLQPSQSPARGGTAKPTVPAIASPEVTPASPAAMTEAPSETLIYPRPLFGSASPDRPGRQEISETRTTPDESAPDPDVGPPEEIFWPLRPLVWIDRGYEALVSWAGAPGQWLAGPGGKTLLGILGLLCLVGAFGLFLVDLLGWTW